MVLPLLALTWMSAVLAVTDRRSALFQILFAVFDSLEGFVIVMVHCILRREVGGRRGRWGWRPPGTCRVPGASGHQPGPGSEMPLCPVLAQTGWGQGLHPPGAPGSHQRCEQLSWQLRLLVWHFLDLSRR